MMDQSHETFSVRSAPRRRDTMSTVSSDKVPSLPTGRWPLTIHGNCARCGHHHKAAIIQIQVVEGICEASHVICERCGQKWLTIGGANTTQISLLSTMTTDLDYEELNFRYTLFSMVRSTASIALPTVLSNVPEDPSPTPSRSSSGKHRGHRHKPADIQRRGTSLNNNSTPALETQASLKSSNDGPVTEQEPSSKRIRSHGPRYANIKRKFKNSIETLKKVQRQGFRRQEKNVQSGMDDVDHTIDKHQQSLPPPRSSQGSVSEINGVEGPCRVTENVHSDRGNAATQAIENLKSFDKEAIRSMTPEQRKEWIREQITTFNHRMTCNCGCKRRHSLTSTNERSSIREYEVSPTVSSFQRIALDQMGSQFDAIPGAFFNHTGPLTISATRISEAVTAVDNHSAASTPRQSRLDFVQQAHRSRSPRPASLLHSRNSWQPSRNARGQRNSMDSILASSTIRSSWRGPARLSNVSLVSRAEPEDSIRRDEMA